MNINGPCYLSTCTSTSGAGQMTLSIRALQGKYNCIYSASSIGAAACFNMDVCRENTGTMAKIWVWKHMVLKVYLLHMHAHIHTGCNTCLCVLELVWTSCMSPSGTLQEQICKNNKQKHYSSACQQLTECVLKDCLRVHCTIWHVCVDAYACMHNTKMQYSSTQLEHV